MRVKPDWIPKVEVYCTGCSRMVAAAPAPPMTGTHYRFGSKQAEPCTDGEPVWNITHGMENEAVAFRPVEPATEDAVPSPFGAADVTEAETPAEPTPSDRFYFRLGGRATGRTGGAI